MSTTTFFPINCKKYAQNNNDSGGDVMIYISYFVNNTRKKAIKPHSTAGMFLPIFIVFLCCLCYDGYRLVERPVEFH
jgi:hypothetical protein